MAAAAGSSNTLVVPLSLRIGAGRFCYVTVAVHLDDDPPRLHSRTGRRVRDAHPSPTQGIEAGGELQPVRAHEPGVSE
jgi:hypothetical protein